VRARVAIAAVLLACGQAHEAPPPPPTTTPPSSVATVAPPTSLVGLDDPPPVPDEVVAAGPLSDRTPTPHGCVLASDAAQPVIPGASLSDVIAVDAAFVVAGYVAGDPGVLSIARIAPGGAPSPLGRIELGAGDTERTAPPVLARLASPMIGIALVDAQGGVRLARFEAGTPAPTISVVQITTSGADRRHPPAIASVDAGTLVAWTDATGGASHVRVARVDAAGVLSEAIDVTPDAGAASAPIFDAHAVLYTMDASAGISVVHRTEFAADGTPRPTTVAQPLSLAADPSSFAVVGSQLAYAAVGNLATRAVGLVTIGSAARPEPLVPGLGYGASISVDGIALGSAALFATEAPSAAEASAPHETRLRVVQADGSMGEPLTIAGVTAPRAAASGGIVAIASRGGSVTWARCAP